MTQHEGYANWETWHVRLLAMNTETVCNQAMALGKRCLEFQRGNVKLHGEVVAYEVSRAAAAFKRLLARETRETREYARQSWPGETPGTIDWQQIAESFIRAAEETSPAGEADGNTSWQRFVERAKTLNVHGD
jgi:hypothetical protein